MILTTFRLKEEARDEARLGVMTEDNVLDLNKIYELYLADVFEVERPKRLVVAAFPRDMIKFIEGGKFSLQVVNELLEYVKKVGSETLRRRGMVYEISKVKFEAPVPKPSKIVCIGLNYEEYRDLLKYEKPEVPLFFLKSPSTIVGHEDNIQIPEGRLPGTTSKCLYQEFELAVIVGKEAKRVPKDEAYDIVFGYTIFHDITAHDIEMVNPGHVLYQQRCKAFDTFSPVGPWIVTKDEIRDPHNLKITRKRNDKVRFESNTRNMMYEIPEIIEFLSEIMILEPGDIIPMGSPPAGPDCLQPGDVIEAEIEKIGTLRNYVVK